MRGERVTSPPPASRDRAALTSRFDVIGLASFILALAGLYFLGKGEYAEYKAHFAGGDGTDLSLGPSLARWGTILLLGAGLLLALRKRFVLAALVVAPGVVCLWLMLAFRGAGYTQIAFLVLGPVSVLAGVLGARRPLRS
jgi:hypothetical protein